MKHLYDFLVKSGVKPQYILNMYDTIRSLELANGFTFSEKEVKNVISSYERYPSSSPNSIHLFSKV